MDAQAEAAYDGNALAGPLSEVFAVEVTTAVGRCRGCGTSSQLATLGSTASSQAWSAAVRAARRY